MITKPPSHVPLVAQAEPDSVWKRWINSLYTWLSVEDWREIGASGEPAFENSWTNYNSATHQTAAFYKDPFGVVHIKGLVKRTVAWSNSVIFTLPEGYTPDLILDFTVPSNGAFGVINIHPSGAITSTIGHEAWLTLDCRFRVTL